MPEVTAEKLLDAGRSLAAELANMTSTVRWWRKQAGEIEEADGNVRAAKTAYRKWKKLTEDPEAQWDPREEELIISCCDTPSEEMEEAKTS